MRIIGGHDYYDSAMRFGHDDSVVLVRERDKRITHKEAQKIPGLATGLLYQPEQSNDKKYRFKFIERAAILGEHFFSGMIVYKFNASEVSTHFASRWSDPLSTTHLWDAESYLAFCEENDVLVTNINRNYWNSRNAKEAQEYFAPRKISSEFRDYMIAERISILVSAVPEDAEYDYRYGWTKDWLVNPYCLKDIGFPKVLDPYTAFQELDMWVSGVLGMPANAMVELSDKMKIHKHGFDNGSFRKPKSA